MQILKRVTNCGEKCPLLLVTPNYYFSSDGYCPEVFNAIMYKTFALLIVACGVAVFVTK